MSKVILLVFGLLYSLNILADGPKKIAKINRALWPYEISSPGEFDFASKMEMLVFVEILIEHERYDSEDSLKKYLGLDKVSLTSVQIWKGQMIDIFTSNFNHLSKTIPHDCIELSKPVSWDGLLSTNRNLEKQMPENLKPWYSEAKAFYRSYIYEQMRLAALFPRTTSEILNLQESEMNGTEFRDKQFLLTFDDGPTPANGNTDKLISTLSQNNVRGMFFVLGDMFDARMKATSPQKLHDLYKTNIVGSHGRVHKSHQKYTEWKSSINFTSKLIDSVFPGHIHNRFFRPPYGQRTNELISYLDEKNARVMLWNIDSQDWNAKITSQEVADRIITLMLVWRKGILLFHDIHPKANEALPMIWNKLGKSGIVWVNPDKL